MPLTPKISNAIGVQNFELIRDQIGAILLVEFTNQGTNYDLPVISTPKEVWVEGFKQIDEDKLPLIVVRCVSAHEVHKDSSGTAIWEYCYYLDIFTGAASTPDDAGDQRSILALQQMIGITRSILEDPRYDLLGFDDSLINIWNTHIGDWYIDLPKNNDDLIDGASGRAEFYVTAAEVPSSYSGTKPVQWVDTNVKLVNSTRGYHWVMKEQEINVTVTGPTLTNSFFTNTIGEIIIADATYSADTDFTQAGTTITAINFTFTASTTITART